MPFLAIFFGLNALWFLTPYPYMFAVAYFQWLFLGMVIKRLFFVTYEREMTGEEFEKIFVKMFPLTRRLFR